jgi:hypothetical protein
VNKLKSKCGGHLSTATRYLQQIDLVSLEGVTMRETGFSQFRIFFDKKKGNVVGLGPGAHIPIFVAKNFVECARSKLC